MALAKVFQNSGIYLFVTMLQKGASFFLLPLYTAFLSPADYGIVGVVNSLVTLVSVFGMLALNGAGSRFYYNRPNDAQYFARLYGTLLTASWLNTLFVVGCLLVVGPVLMGPILGEVSFFPYVAVGLVTVALSPLYNLYQSSLQVRQMGSKVGVNNLVFFAVNVFTTVLFVVYLDLGALGVLAAATVSYLFADLYAAFRFVPDIKPGIDKKILVPSLKYSLPLLPHAIAGWLMGMIDKLFVNGMAGASQAGLYNVGYQFGNIMNLVTLAINQAYVPWQFEKLKEGDTGKAEIRRFVGTIVFLSGWLAFSISLFGKEVILVMAHQDFAEAWRVIPMLSFAFAFHGLYYFFVNILFFVDGGTKKIPFVTIPGSLINVALNSLMIPVWGFVGAGTASLISRIVTTLMVLFVARREMELPFAPLKLYAMLTFFLAASLSVYVVELPVLELFLAKLLLWSIVTLLTIYKMRGQLSTLISLVKRKKSW